MHACSCCCRSLLLSLTLLLCRLITATFKANCAAIGVKHEKPELESGCVTGGNGIVSLLADIHVLAQELRDLRLQPLQNTNPTGE